MRTPGSGRPNLERERTSLYLERQLLQQVDALAVQTQTSRSDVIRRALAAGLESLARS